MGRVVLGWSCPGVTGRALPRPVDLIRTCPGLLHSFEVLTPVWGGSEGVREGLKDVGCEPGTPVEPRPRVHT